MVGAYRHSLLLVAGGELALIDQIRKNRVGGNIISQAGTNVEQEIADHARKDLGAGRVQVCAISARVAVVVILRVLLANRFDVRGARCGQIKEVAVGVVGCELGGLAPLDKVLAEDTVIPVSTRQRRDDDLVHEMSRPLAFFFRFFFILFYLSWYWYWDIHTGVAPASLS
jgi:hypothetical protein